MLGRLLLAATLAGALASGAAARKPAHALCDAAGDAAEGPPYVVVLSAMPSELAPLVAAAEIERTVEVDGRPYYVGRLDGVRVVLGLTLIGMVNAETHTQSVLDAFEAAAVLMSGVAGSHHRIADVVVPTGWIERDQKRVWRANRALGALARRAAAALPAPLERCTPVPPTMPGAPLVCMPHEPAVVFEDRGESGDDFGGQALACVPGGGDVFGCELPAVSSVDGALLGAPAATANEAAADYPDAIDMESAAVARVATEHRVPFLVLRAVSDGAGDPLGDRGFPAQFFDYYRLAARNAAAVTRAVVAELAAVAGEPAAARVCRLLAKGKWRRAARRLGAPAGD